MMTPAAPAASAFATLSAKKQVPRWMSAMFPATKPAKSAASQPLVEVFSTGAGGRIRSTPWTAAVTSPLPEYVIVANPSKARCTYSRGVGAICSSSGTASSWKNGNVNGWIVTS